MVISYPPAVLPTYPGLSWAPHGIREVAWESLDFKGGQNWVWILDFLLIHYVTLGKSLSFSKFLFGKRVHVTYKCRYAKENISG